MPRRTSGNLALASYEDIFQTDVPALRESVQDIPLAQLHPFRDHPFTNMDDEAMQDTIKSVGANGVLTPAIARPRAGGGYELISGHRRKQASELAGYATMPVIVRELDDDTATVQMVDSNAQREKILPSERAKAYRMKLDALNHRGIKLADIPTGKLSVDIVAEQTTDTKSQIYRYASLTRLVPELLKQVDSGKIATSPAFELACLSHREQAALLDAMEKEEATPSLSQAQRLKKLSKAGNLTPEKMDAVMSEQKKEVTKVTLSGAKLTQYFPPSYTPLQMERVIIKLLENWHKRQAAG